MSYFRQSQPVPGTDEQAVVSFLGVSAANTLAWSFTADRRWSLGMLLAAEKNPQANYAMRGNASAGLEFDLVPRQTVNQANLGFRCAIGPELQRYDTTNIEGLDRQAVGRQFCDLFLSWHFLPIDVSASIGEGTVLKDIDYRSVVATLSTTWRLTDHFVITPFLSVQETYKAINEAEPTNGVYADPREEIEASMLAAIRRGYTAPLNIQSTLTLGYLFGNGSLSTEDQRWRRASSLK
jgi:hypothetical protein